MTIDRNRIYALYGDPKLDRAYVWLNDSLGVAPPIGEPIACTVYYPTAGRTWKFPLLTPQPAALLDSLESEVLRAHPGRATRVRDILSLECPDQDSLYHVLSVN